MQQECIFCKIVNGQIPAKLIYQDEHVVAFHDISPAAPVHVLVVPKRHIESLLETGAEDTALLGHVMAVVARLAGQLGLQDGFRTVVNTRANGGQSVNHIHWHILGGRLMNWPPG